MPRPERQRHVRCRPTDTIYNFDTAHDQIDLIGYDGFTTFVDIQAHTINNDLGDAVITLGDGQSITLHGVDANSLSADDFVFDQTPVMQNSGSMTISDGAIIPLSRVIENTGTIELNSTGNDTDLQLVEHGITLEGHGQVILPDSTETSSAERSRTSHSRTWTTRFPALDNWAQGR
jgi:hypothetical protein